MTFPLALLKSHPTGTYGDVKRLEIACVDSLWRKQQSCGSDSLSSPSWSPWPAGSPSVNDKVTWRRWRCGFCHLMLKFQTQAYMNELHQDRLQVTEGGSSLHTETQLLLKVTTKGNLKCREKKFNPKIETKTTDADQNNAIQEAETAVVIVVDII